MKLMKTETGQRVLKDRSVPLTPRQRAAFILFDGRQTVDQILAATGAAGVTREDIDHLVQLGLLAQAAGSEPVAPAAPPQAANEPGAAAMGSSGRDAQQRYKDAYPIATRLTASLGLRGVRLNIAVEGTANYEQLRELAPRIREAVGEKAFRDLDRALHD